MVTHRPVRPSWVRYCPYSLPNSNLSESCRYELSAWICRLVRLNLDRTWALHDGDDGDEPDYIHDCADDEGAGSDDLDDNDDDAGPLDLHEDKGGVEGDGADEVPHYGEAGEDRGQHLERY